jgi:hypothetical protein
MVIKEARPEREFVQPLPRRFRTVEVNSLLRLRKVMSMAVQFESGAPAEQQRIAEERLERDDQLLPRRRSARTG